MTIGTLVGISVTGPQLGSDDMALKRMAGDHCVFAHRGRKADVDYHQPTDVLSSRIKQ